MSGFVKNQKASVMAIVAFMFVTLVACTGMAIDYSRGLLIRSELQSAVDAAALAGGTEANSPNRNALIQEYFNVNLPANYIGATISPLSITLDPTKTILTVSATATLNYSLFSLINKNLINAAANTQVTIETSGMELVLVMDNTGSMSESAGGSVSKIQAAISAGNSLLNILYGANNTQNNLWVGIVPFSDAVNIGTSSSYSGWLDASYDSTLNYGTSGWSGCVEARTNGTASPQYDISDDPPSVKLFRKYYSTCDNYYNVNGWFGTDSNRENCTISGSAQYRSGQSTSSYGPNLYCPQPLQPMVAEKSTISAALGTMQAVGNTHIDLGLAWGWRMLSPRWRGLWGGEMNTNNLPLNYNTPLMTKAIILMTDGDNTLTGASGSFATNSNEGIYTAYGFPSFNALAVTNGECTSGGDCTLGQNEINNRTASICTQMKAQGIVIYTIALGSEISSTGQSLLQNCASNPAYYFASPTTDDLQTAFQQIGDSLNNLRISQ